MQLEAKKIVEFRMSRLMQTYWMVQVQTTICQRRLLLFYSTKLLSFNDVNDKL